MKFEADAVTILGGVRHGETLGSPIAIMIGNSEWPKWTTLMSADPIDPTDPEAASRLTPVGARNSPDPAPDMPISPACSNTTSMKPGPS